MRGPKRREIGHGLLAERALLPVVPYEEDFPYTLRLVSDVLASNGSTSMASVCGSTLSMMAAGVPLKAPVAGIAMGLVYDGGAYVTLTDILGAEDAFGDMDFKVAGTKDVVTALQLDTKIDGLPLDVLTKALLQAKEARLTILDVMAGAIAEPRAEVAESAPKIVSFEIPMDKIGEVIGPKGKVINALQQETGADIAVDDDGMVGTVTIGAKDGTAVEEARRRISTILDPPLAEVGATYQGKVVNITKFGAFVNILPGRDGLLHISKIGQGKRVERVEDVLELGQPVEVTVDDIDPQGKVSLSLAGEPPAASVGIGRRATAATAASGATGAAAAGRPGATTPIRATAPTVVARPAESRRRHRPVPPRSRRPSRSSWSRNSAIWDRPWPSRPTVPAGVAEAAGVVAAAVENASPHGGWPTAPSPCGATSAPMRPSAGSGSGAAPADRMIRTEVLPSGLSLATERMEDARSVCIGFWVGTGSRDEGTGDAGASHFLEHLLFKGTAERSPSAIAEAVDEVGGDFNAFTTKEYTSFYIRLLAEHLPLGLDILSDIMWRPALRPTDLDAERLVILDEILMHADEPSDEAAEQSSAALFPDHPLGREVLGSHDSVAAMTVERIREFFALHYRPGNMVVAVAGDLDHRAVADGLEARFAGQPGGSHPGPPAARRQGRAPAGGPAGNRAGPPGPGRPLGQPHRSPPLRAGRAQPRAGRRALEPAVPGDPGAPGPGLLGVVRAGGLPRRRARSAWGWGRPPSTCPRCSTSSPPSWPCWVPKGITERELAIAKGNLRAETLLACEDSGARMSRIGASLLLHGEILTVDEVLARVEALTLEEIHAAAEELVAAPRTLSVVGPVRRVRLRRRVPLRLG